MPQTGLIPTPDTIPVPWGWFQVLLTVTYVLHLLFMNMMLGGAIIALVNRLRGSAEARPVAEEISRKLPFTVAFAVNAGVAPLLFVQVLYGHFVYTSTVLMAGWWLSIILLLIIAYYAVYLYRFKFTSWGAGSTALIAVAAIIMLFIGFLFTSNMSLAWTPDRWTEYFTNPRGSILDLNEPTLWARYLHMVVGALAVGGLTLAAVGRVKAGRGSDGARLIDHGLAWFTWTTIVQMGVGLWWLMALPEDVMKLFMGGNPVASASFGLGFMLAVVALVLGFRKMVWSTVGLTVATMLAMAVMREYVRYGYLRDRFTPDQLEVDPQISSLILFLVVFVVGLGCVGYMLRLAANAGKEV